MRHTHTHTHTHTQSIFLIIRSSPIVHKQYTRSTQAECSVLRWGGKPWIGEAGDGNVESGALANVSLEGAAAVLYIQSPAGRMPRLACPYAVSHCAP